MKLFWYVLAISYPPSWVYTWLKKRPHYGVLSEDGRVYNVGRWKGGKLRHDGALWLAIRECALLRRSEPRARVVRLKP
jgi:hypothetical protein